MNQKSTQKKSKSLKCNVLEGEMAFNVLNPRKETLALVMQFACSCYVEKKLPLEISTMILN
jgi:hypothetical protein